MNEINVKLTQAIKIGGQELNSLNVRACTLGDVKMAGIKRADDIEDVDKFIKLTGFLTGATVEELDTVDMRDWANVTQAVNRFLGLVPRPKN